FLSQDPGQKARRLARALISDMVVYHPAKRREGLRDGTLKTLFEEEIKKSWEEYTDQVGQAVADSTTHFKDALNEILADGRQIFAPGLDFGTRSRSSAIGRTGGSLVPPARIGPPCQRSRDAGTIGAVCRARSPCSRTPRFSLTWLPSAGG